MAVDKMTVACRRQVREGGPQHRGEGTITREDIAALQKIKRIIARGRNAEVRIRDGCIVVYEVTKHIEA